MAKEKKTAAEKKEAKKKRAADKKLKKDLKKYEKKKKKIEKLKAKQKKKGIESEFSEDDIPAPPPALRERIDKWDPRYKIPCNFSCVTGRGVLTQKDRFAYDEIEFEGCAKITLVDPLPMQSYDVNVWVGAVYTLGVIVMGNVVMAMASLVLQFKYYYMINIHIMACSVGLHVMLPLAYMMREKTAFPGIFLRDKGRDCQSVVLRVSAIAYVGLSYGLFFVDTVIIDKYQFNSYHGIIGFVTMWSAFIELMLHVFPPGRLKAFRMIRKFGKSVMKVATMALASTCFALIISRKDIRNHFKNPNLYPLFITMVVFLSVIAVLGILMKLLSKLMHVLDVQIRKVKNKSRPPCAPPEQ